MAKNAESQKTNTGKIAAFVSSYSNKSTGAGYKNAIEKFLRCVYPGADQDCESLFDQYLREKRDHDQDYVTFANCLKQTSKSALSARQVMTFARRVLEDHGVRIKSKINRDLKREMKGSAGTIDKVFTPKMIGCILNECDPKMKAITLTLVSSGMRLNEVLSLTMSNIDFNALPVKVTLRGSETKNKQSRFTFISTEASEAIAVWISKREAYLNGAASRAASLGSVKDVNTDLIFPVNDSTVTASWETALKAAGVFSVDEQTGRNQLRLHGLRKYFISQISMAGSKTLAEHLSGHAGATGEMNGSYRRIDEVQAGKEYKKVMHAVTIAIPDEFRENHEEIREKMTLQGESLDGLRMKNERLATTIERQQEQIAKLTETMDQVMLALGAANLIK